MTPNESPSPTPPSSYWVIRETWLTRKPSPEGKSVAIFSTLILAACAVLYWTNFGNASSWMPASREAVFTHGEYWRLWSTLFVHGDLKHLLSNAFLFFILGFFLNGHFGWRIFPWAALFWGGLINLAVLPTYDPSTRLIGASGVVYWMGGCWLILYFFLSRQKNFTQRLLRTLGVTILLFMPAEAFEPDISYRTHFVGFALGILVGGAHYFMHRQFYRSAEIRELIVEDSDPQFDPPQTPHKQTD